MLLYNRVGTAIKAALAVAIVAVLAGGLVPTAYSEESGVQPSIIAVFTHGGPGDPLLIAEYLGVSPFTLFKMLEYGVVSIYTNDGVTQEIDMGTDGSRCPKELRTEDYQACFTGTQWIIECVRLPDGKWDCKAK